jgi:hypothetical protein
MRILENHNFRNSSRKRAERAAPISLHSKITLKVNDLWLK